MRLRPVPVLLLAGILAAASVFAGFAGTNVFLPMVGRQPGVYPSDWYTTVWIYNPSADTVTARLYLLVRNTANPSPPSVEVTVPPGDTEKLDNVVETYFHQTVFGAMRVTAPAKLVVTSRVYSKSATAGEKESVGQDFAAVPASFAIGGGETTQVLGVYQTEPSASSDYRYNFGFVETTGHTASVTVTAYDENGVNLGSTPALQVREFSQRQLMFKDYFPSVSTENVRLEMAVSGAGRIIAYGSGIANGSQDPTTFEMQYKDSLLGISSVQHDASLTGDGSGGAPLGVAPSATAGQVLATVAGGSAAPGGVSAAVAGNSVGWQSLGALSLGLTAGGVTFGGSSGALAQDAASLFWDTANKRLGIGVAAPRDALDVAGNVRLAASSATAGRLIIGDYWFLHGFGSGNAFVGPSAGNFTMTGSNDTGVGSGSLLGVTSGGYNTGVGKQALWADTTGSDNTAVGTEALKLNVGGGSNTALGSQALKNLAGGTSNTALGAAALSSSPSGDNNTAVGSQSMTMPSTGSGNTAVGAYTLRFNSTGANNVAVGINSMNQNTFGSANTAVGQLALYSSVTSDNTAVGANALSAYAAGPANTALGSAAGSNVQGSGNVFLGYQAGFNEVGSNSLYIANSKDNTLIYGRFDSKHVGINTVSPSDTLDVNGSARVRNLAGSGVRPVSVDANGVLVVAMPSDERLKKDIVPLSESIDVLAALAGLHGVNYSWDTSQERVKGFGNRREVGLLAQDVEKVLPEVVSTDAEGYRSVDYARLTALLVEVAKVQQHRIDALEKEVAALRR